MQLRQEDKETSKEKNLTNEIIEFVNGQLINAELIKEYTTGVIREIKILETQWKESTKM